MPETQATTHVCVGCRQEFAIPPETNWRFTDPINHVGRMSPNGEVFACWSCLDLAVHQCENCDNQVRRDHSQRFDELARHWDLDSISYINRTIDEGMDLCQDCAYYCVDCDRAYTYQSNAQECCLEGTSYIHNYSFRPLYKFSETTAGGAVLTTARSKPGVMYIGFEIEVEQVVRHLASFYDVSGEDAGSPRFIYIKSDGSLSSHGAEFVTMPATVDAFEKLFPWDAFSTLHSLGARAWAYSSCGMHIHVARSAFTPSHLYKFMKFQLENDAKCISYAGRESDFAEWGNETMDDMKRKPSKYCKEPVSAERYSAINVLPRTTIELRYFRSNILKDGIMRNALWVEALYEYTKTMNLRVSRYSRWSWTPFSEFVSSNPRYQLVLSHMERTGCA